MTEVIIQADLRSHSARYHVAGSYLDHALGSLRELPLPCPLHHCMLRVVRYVPHAFVQRPGVTQVAALSHDLACLH